MNFTVVYKYLQPLHSSAVLKVGGFWDAWSFMVFGFFILLDLEFSFIYEAAVSKVTLNVSLPIKQFFSTDF